MKGKGKWAVLLLVLGMAFTGCFGGGSSTGGSSDEGAVAANDNPILGMFQVTVDPQNAKMEIVPVTLGANSLEPSYSWTNGVIVTDLVTRASASETPTLTLVAYTNLAHGHLIPGSELVKNGGVKCTKGTEYTIKYYTGTAGMGALARTGTAGACNIASGETVTVTYGYGSATNQTWASPDFTTDMSIENHLANFTLEKVRFWTGNTKGLGAAQNPNIAAGYADYPLLQPQSGTTYGKPATTVEPVAGWTAGVCYTSWGHWNSSSTTLNPPNIEGCTLKDHPRQVGLAYAPSWIEPVCGRMTNTIRYTTATSVYQFYLELTGTTNTWNPNPATAAATHDTRFNQNVYSTWYAIMSYLVPDGAGLVGTWCSPVGAQKYWWAGSMVPIKPGSANHCGTLITDPHLPRGAYFAVNFGVEFSDTVEIQAKAFWDAYKLAPNPDVKVGVGAPYMHDASLGVIYDTSTLTPFTANGRTGNPAGSTMFPGGFANNYGTGYNLNHSAGMKKDVGGQRTQFSTTYNTGSPIGYIIAAQYMGAAYAITNFAFFLGNTAHSNTAGSYMTNPYVTQVAAHHVWPASGMPRWAGEWGVAHLVENPPLSGNASLVTEGVDADLDYWLGMIVLKVKTTVNAGDMGSIRFDQTGNNIMTFFYNNRDAANHPSHGGGASEDLSTSYCVKAGGAMAACPGSPDTSWSIWHGIEYPNPALPPGNALGSSSYAIGCPNGDFTCGGHQYVTAVVCIQ